MADSHICIREIHTIGDDTAEQILPARTAPALLARGIWAAGISDAGRGYEMARPAPAMGHLLLCHGGVGEVLVENTWRRCAAGMAYLAPERVPMAFRTVAGERWRFCWIFFQPHPDRQAAISGQQCVLVDADPRQLLGVLEGLYRESSGATDAELVGSWAELVYRYALRITRPTVAADPLWRLWQEVDTRPAEPWALARLAELAGTGEETLRRLCVRHTGRSPMKQVTHLRMRRAEAMLRSSPVKLHVIARAVGYENTFAFSTAFTRWAGHPPSEGRPPGVAPG